MAKRASKAKVAKAPAVKASGPQYTKADPDAPDKSRPYPSALHGWSAHPERIDGGGER